MSRWIATVLALVVGFGIGFLAFKPKAAADGIETVLVFGHANEDDDPDVSPDPAAIPKVGGYVVWLAKSQKKYVRVEFEQEVFENMRQLGNGRWVPDCHGRTCTSDAVKAAIPPDPNKKYKYWQFLHNPNGTGEKKKDGWIIIQ